MGKHSLSIGLVACLVVFVYLLHLSFSVCDVGATFKVGDSIARIAPSGGGEEEIASRPSATCDAFSWHPGSDSAGGCGELPAVSTPSNIYGRLGNMLTASAKMIAYAEEHNCRLELSKLVPRSEPWWTSRAHREANCFVPNNHDNILGSNELCNLTQDWYYHGVETRNKPWGTTELDQSIWKNEFFELTKRYFSDCAINLLSFHLGVNETHVFGRPCPTNSHSVLHVRAGDIFSGQYDEGGGGYRPNKVNPLYIPHPTSYYIAVLQQLIGENSSKKNGEGPHRVIVLCEDLGNPTCEYFQKTAPLIQGGVNVTVRVNEPLWDDLHELMCAREVAVSVGTFQVVLHLSTRLQTKHTYSPSPKSCSLGESVYWIANETERAYLSSLNGKGRWSNTAHQRHLMDRHYEMASCQDSLIS